MIVKKNPIQHTRFKHTLWVWNLTGRHKNIWIFTIYLYKYFEVSVVSVQLNIMQKKKTFEASVTFIDHMLDHSANWHFEH